MEPMSAFDSKRANPLPLIAGPIGGIFQQLANY